MNQSSFHLKMFTNKFLALTSQETGLQLRRDRQVHPALPVIVQYVQMIWHYLCMLGYLKQTLTSEGKFTVISKYTVTTA